MTEFVLKGIVTETGIATLHRDGTHYDYLEIAQGAGHVRRLHDVFVPAALQSDVGLCAIGEFRCREAEPGVSPATEILDFRRADGVVI